MLDLTAQRVRAGRGPFHILPEEVRFMMLNLLFRYERQPDIHSPDPRYEKAVGYHHDLTTLQKTSAAMHNDVEKYHLNLPSPIKLVRCDGTDWPAQSLLNKVIRVEIKANQYHNEMMQFMREEWYSGPVPSVLHKFPILQHVYLDITLVQPENLAPREGTFVDVDCVANMFRWEFEIGRKTNRMSSTREYSDSDADDSEYEEEETDAEQDSEDDAKQKVADTGNSEIESEDESGEESEEEPEGSYEWLHKIDRAEERAERHAIKRYRQERGPRLKIHASVDISYEEKTYTDIPGDTHDMLVSIKIRGRQWEFVECHHECRLPELAKDMIDHPDNDCGYLPDDVKEWIMSKEYNGNPYPPGDRRNDSDYDPEEDELEEEDEDESEDESVGSVEDEDSDA